MDSDLGGIGMAIDEFEEVRAVGVEEENLLTVVAALRDVERVARRGESESARHTKR